MATIMSLSGGGIAIEMQEKGQGLSLTTPIRTRSREGERPRRGPSPRDGVPSQRRETAPGEEAQARPVASVWL